MGALYTISIPGLQGVVLLIVQQIRAIFERNRANDDTSIKFDTLVLQVILIKSGQLAN